MSDTEAAFWNQLQAWAWVYTRNHDVVAGLADGAHEGRSYKQEGKRPGRRKRVIVETPSGPPTSRTINLRALVFDVDLVVSLSDTKGALLDHLLRGEITATGIANNDGDRKPIPAIDWLDLDFYDNPMRVAAKNLSRANATVWHSVKFNRGKMLLIWPDPKAKEPDPKAIEEASPPPKLQQQTVKHVSAAAVDTFFRNRAKNIKAGDRAPSEPEDVKALADELGENAASQKQIRSLRHNFYPPGSIRVGRKP